MVMRYFLLMIVVVLVGCGKKDDGNTGVVNPNKPSPKAVPVNIDNPIVEKRVREQLFKFGYAGDRKLTKEEMAKVAEAAIRKSIKKPTGELTEADLEKVRDLNFAYNGLTDVSGLEKLTQLTSLGLGQLLLPDASAERSFLPD